MSFPLSGQEVPFAAIEAGPIPEGLGQYRPQDV